MNVWAQIPETSAAQGLRECNQCGACCRRNPCFVVPADVARLEAHLGALAGYTQVERTPANRWLVRMRRPCRFLVDNRCSIDAVKPKPARDFACWEPDERNYYWSPAQLKRIGFDVDQAV